MIKNYFFKTFILFFLSSIGSSYAQLSVTSIGTDFTIDFDSNIADVNNDTFTGGGLAASPAAGQLDSDAWSITGFSSTSDLSRGPSIGSESTGGVYAFTVAAGNNALGVQPGGSDFTPGSFTLEITNNTGSSVVAIELSYNVWVYNDQGRGNTFNFSHSADGSSFTDISSLDFTSDIAADGAPSWVQEPRTITINGLSIANGSSYFLRWTGNDAGGSGSRDEFALDDIVVSMSDVVLSTENLDNKLSDVNIYPNPVKDGKIFIKSSSNEVKDVKIYNILGRKVIDTKVNAGEEINVSDLSTGMYMVSITEKNKTLTKKIIIK